MADSAIGRLRFGSRLVFDGGSPPKEPLLKEHWTRNEENTNKPITSTDNVTRQQLEKLRQLRKALEAETDETKEVLRSGQNSMATNQRVLVKEIGQIEDSVDECQSIVVQEVEDEKRHTCELKEAVAPALEMVNGIEEMQEILKPLAKNRKNQVKARENLWNAGKAVEELGRLLANEKRNIEQLEERCRVDKEGDRLLFTEISSALFESNKALLSLRRLAFTQSAPVGQLLLKTEILSQDVVYGLRSVLHTPLSLDDLWSLDASSDSETSTVAIEELEPIKVIKIDSFVSTPNASATSTVKTTVLSTGSRADLSFGSSQSPFHQATPPPVNTSLTLSGLDASFSEAELIEHYTWEKAKDAPEEGVLTARPISSQTRTAQVAE